MGSFRPPLAKLGRIGVLVVYASNKSPNKASLWQKIADSIDKSKRWLVAGDYNMVEHSIDRKGGFGKLVNGREKRAWWRLSHKLNCVDSFIYKVGHFKYSRTVRNVIDITLLCKITPLLGTRF